MTARAPAASPAPGWPGPPARAAARRRAGPRRAGAGGASGTPA
ncbi:hypothetical protein CSC36_6523 [Pseudomonas aeruginosa]|nr:hypothetical protein CSC36_6523 [Pseudomonas aeruginosa]